ncbi:MAG: winged helix-turn-helix domain-containing protein [Sarcina sp.]
MLNEKDIAGFSKAVESLKKYRRADLIDEDGKNILEQLYTDLLPENYILNKSLLDNTTYLIGRKGTGKSTIFLKMERELKKNKIKLPIYVDVKTIYESSQAQKSTDCDLQEGISKEILDKYLLERLFIKNILELISENILETYKSKIPVLFGVEFPSKSKTVRTKIENLINKIASNNILKDVEIPNIKKSTIKKSEERTYNTKRNTNVGTGQLKFEVNESGTGCTISDALGFKLEKEREESYILKDSFSEMFLKVFDIKEIILEIKEILKLLEIKHLIIMLDDLSEIDDNAIVTFVDTIIAPLNNWSDEFIKFKIAVYPNRIHYGKIDPGKIDTINLDFYNLYSEFDRSKMEDYAVNFTQRLLEKRIEYFTNNGLEKYFETTKGVELFEYYELIFQVSMNVPRIIGYILSYCHQNKIIFKKKILKQDIEAAAEKYYKEKIDIFFKSNIYTLKSIDEKISTHELDELKKFILEKLLEIKKKITTGDLKGQSYIKTAPYTSHFNVDNKIEKYLKTLELNHFISKYNEMSDKDGNLVDIFCINYGMAKKHNILWGKPKGSEYRKYFIERPFSFSRGINEFVFNSKIIECSNSECGETFSKEQIPNLEFCGYKCNKCGNQVLIKKSFDLDIEKINKELLLPEKDIKIILELNNHLDDKYARELAEELDYSKHTIASRCKILAEEFGLVERSRKSLSAPYMYRITEKARELYAL